jgi:hypothetical protein
LQTILWGQLIGKARVLLDLWGGTLHGSDVYPTGWIHEVALSECVFSNFVKILTGHVHFLDLLPPLDWTWILSISKQMERSQSNGRRILSIFSKQMERSQSLKKQALYGLYTFTFKWKRP